MSVNLATVQRWAKEIDCLKEWLRYDVNDGKVTRILCALCRKHKDFGVCIFIARPSSKGLLVLP